MSPASIILLALAALGALAWFSTRYAWWRRPVPSTHPRVLMYHMVSEHRPGARFNKLRVPPSRFESQIKMLAKRRANFIFASELVNGTTVPDRVVCITFDDGYADNLLAADPILARYNARATLFLVSDLAGTPGWSSKKKAHHGDDELAAEPKLTDDQVRELLSTGRWELGGHTTTHAHLPSIADAEAQREIGASIESFRTRFDAAPATFAYPFGVFEPRHERMVRDAGFLGAFTTEPAIASHPYADPYSIPRIKVSGKDGPLAFLLRLRGGKRGLNS